MDTYTKKPVTFEAEQFLEGSLPYPVGVSQITHPVLGRVFVLSSPAVGLRVRNTDWIVTLPDGQKIAMSNAQFTRTYKVTT